MPIEISRLDFSYGDRGIFRELSCTFRESEVTAVVGPSGCGKSTLLSLLVGAERAEEGSISYPEALLAGGGLDGTRLAWVTQQPALMLRRSALANVAVVPRLRGLARRESEARANAALRLLEVEPLAGMACGRLSGGERQRVAIARALVAEARLIVADEPTAALDAANRDRLMGSLRVAARSESIVVIATHDRAVVDASDAVVDLESHAATLVPRRLGGA